jgi:hypothetical protein
MKYSAKDFKLNNKYSYLTIENFNKENSDFTLTELGDKIIGENFLILKDNEGSIIVFILDSYNNENAIYNLIYTNF